MPEGLVAPRPATPGPVTLRRITPHGDARLAQRLRGALEGEVLFTRGDRARYATDASIYQIEPVGVAVPRTVADLQAAMAIAREHDLPVLARGGGTSQCGQTVNRALVLDCSKYLRRVLDVDAAAGTAWVEPGIVLGHLNAQLKPHGLFFPVDPSTHARCTIGGMAANNSCGSKSIRYGLMADNVLAIDALLADGTRTRFGPVDADGPAGLVAALRRLGTAEAEEIAARFPSQLRSVGGYGIQALTPSAMEAGRGNLARLLVGSEGTLAISAAVQLRLWPIKPRPIYDSLDKAAPQLTKQNPQILFILGQCYQKSNDNAKARAAYVRFLSFVPANSQASTQVKSLIAALDKGNKPAPTATPKKK